MQAKPLHAAFLQLTITFEQLCFCESVFGLFRLTDNYIPLSSRSGVVSKTDEFRQTDGRVDIINVADVIQIQNRTKFLGSLKLIHRSVIRSEHDILTPKADFPAENQLRMTRTVSPQSLAANDVQNIRIGKRFDGEVISESGAPRKGGIECLAGLADSCLVVDVKWCRIPL